METRSSPAPPPATPAFFRQPLSWEKLQALEDWMVSAAARRAPELVVEADLLLSEGRLAYARQDQGATPENVVQDRLAAAQAGFERVRRSSDASFTQRSRANVGLTTIERVRATPSGPAMLSRVQWGAAEPIPARMTRNRYRWTRITVHHSTIRGSALAAAGLRACVEQVRRLQSFHMNDGDRAYGDVGYHYLIDPAGRVYEGRSLAWQGAHAAGANNHGNIGICLLGNFDEETPRPEALAALAELIEDLRARHGIARSQIFGHSEMRATECPGRKLLPWVHRYRS